jgi:hypothetical protein
MKWVALLGVLAVWRLAPLQGGEWSATPATPTVGDTVWLEREIAVPVGWRIRVGKLDATEQAEPLAEPTVQRTRDGWLVRYPIVAWTPGTHALTLPPVWRLRPDGRADSVAGGVAHFFVGSVIPDTVRGPQPRGALAPVRGARRSALPVATALLLAGAILAVGLRWRRRAPRTVPPPPPVPLEREVPDARWLAAGEPKAVAVRATYRLRVALARAIPDARLALSTSECLVTVERVRPHAPLRELRALLEQLDRVAFASAHGTDLAGLAHMARRLAQEIAP